MRSLLPAALALLVALTATSTLANAPSVDTIRWTDKDNRVNLYFYTSASCPHCARATAFLKREEGRNPWLRVRYLEIDGNQKNREEFSRMAAAMGERPSEVPAFFMCREMYMGYGDDATTGRWLIDTAAACRKK
ncbi:MAG: glutaredoxin family protein [Thiotrichales bacterium]